MAKTSKSFPASALTLLKVKIIEGIVESPEDFDEEAVALFDPECALEVSRDGKGEMLRADLKVWVNSESAPAQHEAHGHYHFHFFYAVAEPERWLLEDPKAGLLIDGGLLNAIAAVSYSTARGILLGRFQGTVFQRFILPVIDTSEIVEQPQLPKPKSNPKGA